MKLAVMYDRVPHFLTKEVEEPDNENDGSIWDSIMKYYNNFEPTIRTSFSQLPIIGVQQVSNDRKNRY